MAHTAGVYEHGAGDRQVQWLVWEDENGKLAVHEMTLGGDGSGDPVTITVRREDGSIIPPSHKMFDVEGGLLLTLGVDQGQHSGAEACLMRYDTSWAYISDADPNMRYFVKDTEKRGATLCDSPAGTGVNALGRNPQSRYGGAAPGRGDCMHQICVNDAVSPPLR